MIYCFRQKKTRSDGTSSAVWRLNAVGTRAPIPTASRRKTASQRKARRSRARRRGAGFADLPPSRLRNSPPPQHTTSTHPQVPGPTPSRPPPASPPSSPPPPPPTDNLRPPAGCRLKPLMASVRRTGREYLRECQHCNFLSSHFQPFGLNLVLPSVVKPSGEIAERGKRHPAYIISKPLAVYQV